MNIKTKITKLHYDKEADGVLTDLLDMFSYFYGVASSFKNFLYDKNIIRVTGINPKYLLAASTRLSAIFNTRQGCRTFSD